jgi:hypothetical protein
MVEAIPKLKIFGFPNLSSKKQSEIWTPDCRGACDRAGRSLTLIAGLRIGISTVWSLPA